MGGTVAETIRKKDGKIIKMARKTGAYNWLLYSKNFNDNKEDLAIDEHCKIFFEMREDYLNGEPYKYNMSEVYGWCQETMPVDYGLVVLDFHKNKIHSMQGYDTPGLNHLNRLSDIYVNDIEEEKSFEFLVENNLINIYKITKDGLKLSGDIESFFGKKMSLKDIRKEIKNDYSVIKSIFKSEDEKTYNLQIKTKLLENFEIIRYDETPEGTIQMFESLVNDNFNFNEEELEGWKSHIKYFDIDFFYCEEDGDNEVSDEVLENRKKEFIEKIDTIVNQKKIKNKI